MSIHHIGVPISGQIIFGGPIVNPTGVLLVNGTASATPVMVTGNGNVATFQAPTTGRNNGDSLAIEITAEVDGTPQAIRSATRIMTPDLSGIIATIPDLFAAITTLAAGPSTVQPEGIHTVSIRVQSSAFGLGLAGATVRIDTPAASIIPLTDSGGSTVAYVPGGTYTVAALGPGHQIATQTITVDADTDITITADPLSTTSADHIAQVTARCINGDGSPAATKTYNFRLIEVDDNANGIGDIYSGQAFQVMTDSAGNLTAQLVKGATYAINAGESNKSVREYIGQANHQVITDIIL